MHVCTKLTCKQKNINNYRKVLYTLYIYIFMVCNKLTCPQISFAARGPFLLPSVTVRLV